MGKPGDPKTVLDGQCRVIGCDSLRVVDASSFPHIPGMFIMTSIYLLSEKIAEDIIAEYQHVSSSHEDRTAPKNGTMQREVSFGWKTYQI